MSTLTGHEAIDHAARTGASLRKYADPVDGARGITLDEAREIAFEDAGLVWCEADARTEAASAALRAEMRRVFGAPAEAASLGGGLALAHVDGWPERVTYRAAEAVAVLRGFGDAHGATEAGDAEVCAAVEAAGAFVAG